MNIAPRLQAVLDAKGWTNAELCRRAGLHPTHLWKILEGQRNRIEADTVKRLARALAVTTDYLMSMDMPDIAKDDARGQT